MSDNKQIILASACLFFGLIYLIKSRRSNKSRNSEAAIVNNSNNVSERVHQNPLSTWLKKNFSFSKLASDSWDHPEGPNIGFESNDSWFKGDSQPAKIDLLHQGHTKGGKLVIVMVGLPGRGKTYIARKIARYLRWISYRTRAFSLAKYRLDKLGNKSAEFFDPASSSCYQQRVGVLIEALEDSMRYLSRGGEIAILDGTNITRDRRDITRQRINQENNNYDILWIESVYTSDEIFDRQMDKLRQSPDFLDHDDYMRRLALYKQSYQTLADDEGSFAKVYDDGKQIVLQEIFGFLRTKIVSFLMNVHTYPRPIYMVRHGQSDFNTRGLIGGDSALTPLGLDFSKALGEYLHSEELTAEESESLCVWTSNMRRARQTAGEVKCKKLVEWRALREIEVGICDGLSYDQVKIKFPDEFRSRQQDKLHYRYPRGESYLDVITRLEPVILEMERQREPLLIVAHQAVLRCLYAYFLDLPTEEIPFLSLPLHTLIKLEVNAYSCREKRVRLVTASKEERDGSRDGEGLGSWSRAGITRDDSMTKFQL